MRRVDGNDGSTLGYEPNSYGEWAEQPEQLEPALQLDGAMYHYEPKDDQTDNCFYQAGNLYRLISEPEKQVLCENTNRNMEGTTDNIKYRHAAHCFLADEDYGNRLCAVMGLEAAKAKELSALSYKDLMRATSAGVWGTY